MFKSNPNLDIAKIFFGISVSILILAAAFLFGVATQYLKIWPHDLMWSTARAAISLIKYGEILPEELVSRKPGNRNSVKKIELFSPGQMMPGYRAFTGYDKKTGQHATWLINEKGENIHSWPINYALIIGETSLWGSDKAMSPHGVKILKDGSILLNFDGGDVLTRLDACGKPIWTARGTYHHSIEGSEDGTYWTWKGGHTAYGDHQYLVNFDPADGRVLKSIHLLKDIAAKSNRASIYLSVPEVFKAREFKTKPNFRNDIFHPNDIEPLSTKLAPKFPMFSAGDLLISLRNINLVGVVSPNTGEVKWVQRGPWLFQHDPDFLEDGTISIYNNNSDRGRSNILVVDPANGEVRRRFTKTTPQFYSYAMGKHDQIPGGAVLVTVPSEGRVLELNNQGEVLMEYNNTYNNTHNAIIVNASWLPKDYFTAIPSCKER